MLLTLRWADIYEKSVMNQEKKGTEKTNKQLRVSWDTHGRAIDLLWIECDGCTKKTARDELRFIYRTVSCFLAVIHGFEQ